MGISGQVFALMLIMVAIHILLFLGTVGFAIERRWEAALFGVPFAIVMYFSWWIYPTLYWTHAIIKYGGGMP